MDRRSLLATTGAALSATLGGCLGGITGDRDREPGTTDDPGREPGTTGEQDGVHDLVAENHTSTTETARIAVVREDGATLVDGRYELPDGRGIEFESIAAWATAYTVELAIDGGRETSLSWYTAECGPDSEAPGDAGSRNAFVRVEDAADGRDRISLVRDECDALYGPSVPTGPAERFRLDG